MSQGMWPDDNRWYERELAWRLADARLRRKSESKRWGCQVNPYTQEATAARIGVSHASVSHWESGAKYPGCFGLWMKWATAVGEDFPTLFAEVCAEAGRAAA